MRSSVSRARSLLSGWTGQPHSLHLRLAAGLAFVGGGGNDTLYLDETDSVIDTEGQHLCRK